MPEWTKEEKREYHRQYRLKNKEKLKEYHKKYSKEYNIKNRDKLNKKAINHSKTYKGIKSTRINKWKSRGILCFNWDLLYDIFLSTKNCEYCNCELTDGLSANSRCLDHNHNITDKFNIRGVLCRSCNVKDVLK